MATKYADCAIWHDMLSFRRRSVEQHIAVISIFAATSHDISTSFHQYRRSSCARLNAGEFSSPKLAQYEQGREHRPSSGLALDTSPIIIDGNTRWRRRDTLKLTGKFYAADLSAIIMKGEYLHARRHDAFAIFI